MLKIVQNMVPLYVGSKFCMKPTCNAVSWKIIKLQIAKISSNSNICLNLCSPSNARYKHIFGLTLAQVVACCLITPSHYLNQCWIHISDALVITFLFLLTVIAQATISYNRPEIHSSKITAISPYLPGANELILSVHIFSCMHMHKWTLLSQTVTRENMNQAI